ncbi:DUF3800 domain-containing protein [Mesorhizobium sp. M1169]|uniref:DUF3800 domain-containing protein n=1 Tax=unclassified Mesorhizobium TaxID=325217 RepID=UPI003336E958
MLKAFIDDSDIGSPPVYILAGWVAPAKQWAAFSDEWDRVLRMSPRIRYFKFVEAMSFNGEFGGMSLESRDEKLKLLVGLIEEYKLLGISAVMPHKIFFHYFGRSPEKEIRTPYYPMVFSLIGRLLEYQAKRGITDRTEFVFDVQPGKIEYVLAAWEQFRRNAPAELLHLISPNPPSFQSDTDVVPLQAADLYAGWSRRLNVAALNGESEPVAPWGNKGSRIRAIGRLWDEDFADRVYAELYGYPPVKFTYSFQYGMKGE